MANLPLEFAICAGMTALVAVVHLLGLMGLVGLVRFHIRHLKSGNAWLDRLAIPLVMVGGLFIIHGIEIWTFALLFTRLGAIGLEAGLFASTAAYTTVEIEKFPGLEPWRLITAYESLVGMLCIGWSTAFLFATLHRILTTEETHPLPEGAIAVETGGDD